MALIMGFNHFVAQKELKSVLLPLTKIFFVSVNDFKNEIMFD